MSRKLLVGALISLMLLGCRKNEANTDTATATSTSATTSSAASPPTAAATSTVVPTSTAPVRTAAAGKVLVEIHVVGLCGIVDQQDASTFPAASKTVIIPKVAASTHMPEHTPFIAWRFGNEATPPGTVEDVADPVDSSSWRVHPLEREEIVLPDLKATNPAVNPTTTGTCAPDFSKPIAPASFDCFPSLGDFLIKPAPLEPSYLLREKPSADIAGRIELAYGTLHAFAGDRCQWAVFKNGQPTPSVGYLANDLVYAFEYPENSKLTIRTRKLDDPVANVSDLLTLNTPAASARAVQIRVGNLVILDASGKKSFPGESDLHGFDDLHYAAYYKFFQGVKAEDVPVPHRTTACIDKVGPFTPDVYCGPGYVKPKP